MHADVALRSSFLQRVSPCLLFTFLQGMAGAVGISHFLRVSEHSASQSPLTHDSDNTTTALHELALWWFTTLPGWSITRVGPSQHPQYTRADFGQQAVGGSLTASTTSAQQWAYNKITSIRCIRDDLFEFHILRINEINSSQSSSMLELWFLAYTLLLFLHFWVPWHTSPDFWPRMIRPWFCLLFRQSHPGPHVSVGRLFF